MNTRARNRLIGVSVILVILVVAGFVFVINNGASLSLTVDKLHNSPQYIGETIRISGTVVAGSWDRQENPMTFRIFDEDSDSGTEVTVIFDGHPPANFGDGTGVIIDGIVDSENTIKTTRMATVCPSRYETSDNTLPVAALFDESSDMDMAGIPVRVSARVVNGSIAPPGSEIRLVVHDIEDPSIEMPVIFAGGLADTIEDGTPVVLTGNLNADDVFEATIVANIADS